MLALTALPVSWLTTVGQDHICAATVFGSIPVSCNAGSLGGKGIVLAEFSARALWTSCAITSVMNSCLPLMQMPIRTLSALPPDCSVAEFFEDNITQIQVGWVIPFLLQRLVQSRDVWTCCLFLLLLLL